MLNALLQQEAGLLFVLCFAAGLGIWWLTAHTRRNRKQAGEVSIHLDTVTPRIGSALRGQLAFARPISDATCQLKLVCEHIHRQGDSAQQRTIWTDVVTLSPQQGNMTFAFALPAHLPASTPLAPILSPAQNRWRLLLQSSAMSGPIEFEVYVRDAISPPTLSPVVGADIDPAPATVLHPVVPTRHGMADAARIEDELDTLRIVLVGQRSRRDALPTLLFALLIGIFGGLTFATLSQVFGLLILLFAALIVPVALRTLFDEQTLTLHAGWIDLTRRTLFRTRQARLSAKDIDRLVALPEASAQISLREDFQSFTLYAVAGNEGLHVLFTHVIGSQLAESLLQYIHRHLAPVAEVANIHRIEQNRQTLASHPARSASGWQKHALQIMCAAMALTAIGLFSDPWRTQSTENLRPRIEASAEAWFAAMEANRLDDLQAIAELGFPIDIQAANGSNALALACSKGHLPIVQWLLEAGADLHQRNSQPDDDNYRSTPLMRAGYGANPDVVTLLLTHGARIHDTDAVQRTPLHYMAWGGCSECIRQLAKRGAALEARASGSRGETPLMLAASSGHIDAVKTLLAAGADLTARDHHGYDALAWAAFHNQSEIIEYLKLRQDRQPHRQPTS